MGHYVELRLNPLNKGGGAISSTSFLVYTRMEMNELGQTYSEGQEGLAC